MMAIWNLITLASDNPGWTLASAAAFVAGSTYLTMKVKSLDKDIKSALKQMDKGIKQLNKRVDDIWRVIPKTAFQSSSPLALNPLGKEIAKKIDAREIAGKFSGKVKLSANANAYHIQEACFDYAENKLLKDAPAEIRDKLENYAFDSGNSLEIILQVIGLELRDVVLGEKIWPPEKLIHMIRPRMMGNKIRVFSGKA